MSSFEIIDPKKPVEENKLPNGVELLQHEVNAFSNHYSNGKSFDDLEKKSIETGTEPGIHFGIDFKLHPDAVKKLDSIGQQVHSNACILQHNLVMYSFVYGLSVVGENETEGLFCKLSIAPISYTYKYPTEMAKGGVQITFKPEVPELKEVKWVHEDGTADDLFKEDNGHYSCVSMIPLKSLNEFTEVFIMISSCLNMFLLIIIVQNGCAVLRVEMTIDKEYFDIQKYIDLDIKEAYVAPNSYKILDKILMGEQVPKSDWVISASEGFPRDFHVHGPVLADSSYALRAAVTSHMCISKEIAMISHENRFVVTSLKSKDMRVILTYIYHRRFVLPEFDAVSRIGKVLSLLFKDDILKFFESWNAKIIKNLRKLDRSDSLKTIAECVKALICVTSAPQGSLLGVYNVALIVAADAWQMTEIKGKKLKKEKVKKEIGKPWTVIDDILELIDDFKTVVCGVEKMEFIE
ncbi:hypothetical protein CRE_04839 [Caenorhabditis remanei]|uniref:BTB domain-containing protein n=1 Tax=Caenorhabditis remanei TaxID=31234 RepID=E3LYD8_CAERE|nr:hypothetical protein CRE_04839 [Caenorhabditis remanei]